MPGSWRTVRVFVSSTFRDMGAERDWLARVVFPELRERCAERQLYLTDVDLRWGVTEAEAEQGKVLAVCLEEIDRCRPFFLGLLGERYGWVPETLPEEAVIEFPWVDDRKGHSVTELEILHGVLNNPEMAGRAFFFFRELLANTPLPADYQAETPGAAEKLAKLKNTIREAKLPVTEYTCRWEGQVVGLEDFGKAVLEELWTAICQEYPEDASPPDPLAEEIGLHEAQAARLVAGFVGRAEEKRQLTQYVESDTHRALALTGPPGSGKSALLADWSLGYREAHPEAQLVLHFVGASPSSTSHVQTMRRIGEELKRQLGLFSELPDKPEGLEVAFRSLLIEAGERAQGSVILVLDGLNQLEASGGALGLAWLPEFLPAGVRILASTLEGQPLEALHRHGAQEFILAPLTTPERKQFVTDFLGEYRKKLSDSQLEALLAKEATENALYLKVALEELRLFGSFEELTQRIERLPATTEELFGQVLDRVEGDHQGVFPVAEGLALLAASRSGLSERELLELVGGEVTALAWARVRRSLAPYLVQRGELLDFAHRNLWKAVKVQYSDTSERHLKLADYFLTADTDRRVVERPWQLEQAEAWEALKDELVSLEVMQWFNRNRRGHDWFTYWKKLEGRYEPGTSCLVAVERDGDELVRAIQANEAGLLLHTASLHRQAMPLYERALKINEAQLEADHPLVATSLNNLAALYYEMGQYARALPMYERALAIEQAQLGASHPDTATSINNLAVLYKTMGHYREALAAYHLALGIRESRLGPNHPLTAQSLYNLAALYGSMGQYEQALPLSERAFAVSEAGLGESHPYTAYCLNGLAGLYCSMGRYETALPLYERALAIGEAQLGANHPDNANSLNGLASLYQATGQYGKALSLFERTLRLCESQLGVNHPSTATSLNNLALLHQAMGEYEEALSLYERALKILEAQFGAEHLEVANSLNNLAMLYYSLRLYDLALPLYERALSVRELKLGPDHPETAQSLNNLGVLLKATGQYEQALPMYKRALSINEVQLGPEHPSTAQSLNNLGVLYKVMGQYEQAVPLYERALAISEWQLGADHPNTAINLNNLAMLYKAMGYYDKALPLLERAVEVTERALGSDHQQAKDFKDNFEVCKRAMGQG